MNYLGIIKSVIGQSQAVTGLISEGPEFHVHTGPFDVFIYFQDGGSDVRVTDFTLADLSVSNATLSNLTGPVSVQGLPDYAYLVTVTPRPNSNGNVVLSFASNAEVTVGALSRSITGRAQRFPYNTHVLSATLGTPVVDNAARTVVIRATFNEAIDPSTFTRSDVETTTIGTFSSAGGGGSRGYSVRSVSRVGGTSTSATVFDITFSLPQYSTATVQVDIGSVTPVGETVSHAVVHNTVNFTFNTGYITAGITGPTNTQTSGFDVTIIFAFPVTDFELGDMIAFRQEGRRNITLSNLRGSGTNYRVHVSPTPGTSGNAVIHFNTSGRVTHNGLTAAVAGGSITVPYDIPVGITASFLTSLDNLARTATTRITFSSTIDPSSFVTGDVHHNGAVAGVDFTLERVDGTTESAKIFNINWTLPADTSRNLAFSIPGAVDRPDGTSVHVSGNSNFTFDTRRHAITAVFSDTVVDNVRRTARTRVTFSESVNLTSSHVTHSGVAGADFTIELPIGGRTSIYDIVWTFPNVSGTVSFDISGLLRGRGLTDGRVYEVTTSGTKTFAIVQLPSINATFSRGVFSNNLQTYTVRCTFENPILVSSFTRQDVKMTQPPTLSAFDRAITVSVSQVNSGTTDDEFDLIFTLGTESGTLIYDIDGSVTEGSTNKIVSIAPGSVIVGRSVTAGLTKPPLPITTQMFVVECRFARVVGDFTPADVLIVGANRADLTLNSITALPGGTAGQDYHLNFSIPADKAGSATIDIGGTVTVDNQSIPVSVGAESLEWNNISAIAATFGTAVVNNTERTVTVRASFERAIDVASFTASDIQIGTAPVVSTSVAITQVNSGSTDDEFDIVITLPADSNGSVSYDINGTITESMVERSVQIDEASVTYDTRQEITATIGETVVDNAGATARTRISFDEIVSRSSVQAAISHSGVDDVSFSVVDDTSVARYGFIDRFATAYYIQWALPSVAVGTVSFEIAGELIISTTGGSVQSIGQTRRGNLTSVTSMFDINTRTPVTAGLTKPALPIKTRTFSVACRFARVVGDFAIADIAITGTNRADLTLSSITALPGGTAGQDYNLNFTIAADKVGTADIDITGTVTVDSTAVPVLVGAEALTWDTRTAISATFGTAVVDAVARTVTVRATFARAIDVASFVAGDVQIGTTPVVETSVAVSQANTGSTDDEFNIVISLPEDSTGSVSYDINGKVTENMVSRDVLVDEASTEYTTFPTTITPTMKNHTGTKTGDFSVEVNFGNTGVSGFEASEVRIGLRGVVAAVVSLGAGIYRIDFTMLPSDRNGTFTLDLIGSVQVAMAGSRSITFDAVMITYDTRTPIGARWFGAEGVITSRGFSLDIEFDTAETVTDFIAADLTITRISGATLSAANLDPPFSFFVPSGLVNGKYQFTLLGNRIAAGVSGVFSIAVTGRVSVGGVDKAVSAGVVQVAYDTTGTAAPTAAALVVISPAERPLGVLADQPISEPVTFDITFNRDIRFDHNDILIHESTAADARNPLEAALANVGTIGTRTHYRLTYTPPANAQGEVYIEVEANVTPTLNNLPGYSAPVAYDTRPPRIVPEPIWTVPDGTIFDATTTFDVDLNFGENITGFDAADVIVEGIANQTTLVYRVVGGREILHTDDTPAALFRLKIRPHANQRGVLSVILRRGTITSTDDMTMGPASNSQSPPISYDTVPMPAPVPEPVFAEWTRFPASILDNNEHNFDLEFSRAVSGLDLADIAIIGLASNRLLVLYYIDDMDNEQLHTDSSEAYSHYRLKLQVLGQQEGNVGFSLRANNVTASDGGTGPPTSITSPGIPYDTTPEPVAPPEPVQASWVAFPSEIIARNTDYSFDIMFDRAVQGLTLADFTIHGLPTNRLFQLYKVIDDVESLHTDASDAASLYRIKLQVRANLEGEVWFTLKPGTVSAADNGMGPLVAVNSPGVQYDTIPEPVTAEWIAFPPAITETFVNYNFDIEFSRPVNNFHSGEINVIGLDTGRVISLHKVIDGVESQHTNLNDYASIYRIKVLLRAEAKGVLWVSMLENTIHAADNGTGPPMKLASPGVPYDTVPEQVAVPDPVFVNFGTLARQTAATFEVNVGFSELVTDIEKADFALSGDTTGIDFEVSADTASNSRVLTFTVTGEIEGAFSVRFTGDLEVDGEARAYESFQGFYTYDRKPEPTPVSPMAEVSIGPPQSPVGQVANQPFKGTEVWHDITFSEDITDTDTLVALSAAITLRDTANAGPANVLAANLRNVGTSGTRTHFRLRVPIPENTSGVYWLSVRAGFINNNLSFASTPVWYDRVPAPTPVADPIPPAPTWENVPNRITAADSPTPIDLNFGENITGLVKADIVIEGVSGETYTLFRVVGGTETEHTNDTPAALFRVKVSIPENQIATMTLYLKRNSVTAEDDDAVGPVLDVLSPGIAVDTTAVAPVAVPNPVIDTWDTSDGNRFGETYVFTAMFSRAVANTVAELRTSLVIVGVDIDPSDTDKVAITKAADNLSATITITPDATFEGLITVGIEEDDLRNVE